MKNKEYLTQLNDQELAELIDQSVFKEKVRPEDLCRNVCKYADEQEYCTRFDKAGNVDCPWTFEERIINWLNAERTK